VESELFYYLSAYRGFNQLHYSALLIETAHIIKLIGPEITSYEFVAQGSFNWISTKP